MVAVSVAAFAGAYVAGVAGFGFAAAAGAIVLHVIEPTRAIVFLMICSVIVQFAGLVRLRAVVDLRGSAIFVLVGLAGAPLAAMLLARLDAQSLRILFGAFLITYAAHAGRRILRNDCSTNRLAAIDTQPPSVTAVVGFCGGLVGGFTAMPGAVLAAWCDWSGYPKERQRGIVQPFILAMQISALAWIGLGGTALDRDLLFTVGVALPFLAIGVALGVVTFERLNAKAFRLVVLWIVAVSGALLVFPRRPIAAIQPLP